MGARESLQKLIDRKIAEIDNLEQQIRDAKVYLQAVQDSFRLLPKEETSHSAPKELRPGSVLAQVKDFLKREGSPQHISSILEFLGKPIDKANRTSLTGSLGGYVKEKRIFTRTGPNTFGLIEFEFIRDPNIEILDSEPDELPVDFGKL
jgi:hypothetical protein